MTSSSSKEEQQVGRSGDFKVLARKFGVGDYAEVLRGSTSGLAAASASLSSDFV